MEKQGFFVETKQLIEEYVEDRILLLKLQVTEKAAKLSSVIFIAVIVIFLLLLIFMIATFIAGYYLSKAVGSYAGGFGILAAFYILLMGILIYIHRRFLGNYISNKVVKMSFSNKERTNGL